MNKNPYKKYWFSRRAVERLTGEIRPTVAYHIRVLIEYDVITSTMHDRAACYRQEGKRKAHR